MTPFTSGKMELARLLPSRFISPRPTTKNPQQVFRVCHQVSRPMMFRGICLEASRRRFAFDCVLPCLLVDPCLSSFQGLFGLSSNTLQQPSRMIV
jgi:hypothetical protein